MASPVVPQRPARSRVAAPAGTVDVPNIPPRPKRSMARSVSPQRDSFARSPLNDLSAPSDRLHGSSSLSKSVTVDTPPRPPSVDFPSIGEEGHEYAQIQEHLATPDAEEVTKAVAGDLPLHAPKASLPASAAKSKISAVTRTDSSQAAAAGFGKAHSDDHMGHSLTRTNSTQPSRPTSLYSKDHGEGEEQGIPEIGVQIPLYPNAGDVQAPSPAPALFGSGMAQQNTSQTSLGRHHTRTKSGREIFIGPPGSYGMHGHGVNMADPFEKDWYLKHPEMMKKEEQGEYGPAISEHRKEWALTSEELNRLVHHPNTGKSFSCYFAFNLLSISDAADAVTGTPAEEVGYIASEEYASRMASPRPASTQPKERRLSGQVHAESPLRRMSFPVIEVPTSKQGHDHAVDSEAEHEDIIHVDPISRTASRVNEQAEDLDAHGTQTEHEDDLAGENGYTAPILAEDEVKYRPESQFLQPAIEPELERHDSSYLELEPATPPPYASGRRGGRPISRTNTMPHMSRFPTADDRPEAGTPLEDVKEYEPLFPEDGEKSESETNVPPADKPKRPDLARHTFPSRDVWEDAPNSLMYETTVKTPQLPEFSIPAAEHEPKEIFETQDHGKVETNIGTIDQEETPVMPDVLDDTPPVLQARHQFPSRDVWEDTADSLLHTTVITPKEIQSPEAPKAPIIPVRPSRAKPSPLDLAGPSSPEDTKPAIPERPKPKVPERPSKAVARGASAEEVPLAKSTAQDDGVKAKPSVPARPSAGSKIAALQAGFMKDLNQRLQLGPPKKEGPAKADDDSAENAEQTLLADARKGRARGPQRRKRSTSPSATGSGDDKEKRVRFAIAKMVTVFEIDERGAVRVSTGETAATVSALTKDVLKSGVETEATAPVEQSPAHATVQTGKPNITLPQSTDAEDLATHVGGPANEPDTVVEEDNKQIAGEADA